MRDWHAILPKKVADAQTRWQKWERVEVARKSGATYKAIALHLKCHPATVQSWVYQLRWWKERREKYWNITCSPVEDWLSRSPPPVLRNAFKTDSKDYWPVEPADRGS